MSGSYRFNSEQSQRTIERILKVLEAGPKTRAQIGAAAFLCPGAVSAYVKHLHRSAPKRIYVFDHEPMPGQPWTQIFAAGNRPDKPKPKPKTRAQRARETRSRIRKDPVRLMRYEATAKMRSRRRRTTVPVDPLTGWIPRRIQEHQETA